MEENEERLKVLEGITYREWQKLKIVVDDRFSDLKEKNTFIFDKDVLDNLKIIS